MAPDGPELSELVQGYWRMADWQLNTQQQLTFLKQHVDLGVSTVDHAHVYGSNPSCEELFGKVLKLAPSVRDQIEIVSKCGIQLAGGEGKHVNHYDSTPDVISASVDTSLSRLGVGELDVLLLHRPDWLMNVDDVAATFKALRTAGKVKHFGVSNFTASQFSLLQSRLDYPLVTNQLEINPVNLSVIRDGTLDQLYQARVRPMAWSCLAGGRIFTESSEQVLRLKITLQEVAEEVGATGLDQVIYKWVMMHPSKPVAIIGSGNIQRIKAAAEALSLRLTNEQWYRILVASIGQDVP